MTSNDSIAVNNTVFKTKGLETVTKKKKNTCLTATCELFAFSDRP